ncbi:MAG: DegQ family serine endoprotease [Alphaproteobacteria bacterium]|nr:MAG: DegQ family serine endoprotease [Alphaproteobacteria bacterium]
MNDNRTPGPARGIRTARRLVLLASTAGLGIAVLLGGPGNFPSLSALSTAALAQSAQRPAGFADVVEKVKPAVISVRVKLDEGPQTSSDEGLPFPQGSPFDRFFRQFGAPNMPNVPSMPNGRHLVTGQGSGFFISADGYAVTNNHVVDKAKTVEVTTDDGKSYTAKVIGTDPKTDLALIKIDGRGDFSYVKFADATPRVGDWVLAVGNPFGLGGTVTAGIVSARGRDIGAGPYDDFIQIDAPVNKGNSGGPSFDVNGNVIGVNTAIFSPSGGSVGIGFAIPSDTVKTVIAQLEKGGKVTRGWIGVQIQQVTPDIAESLGLKNAEGALVAEPQADSPAAKAGIQSGDVITAVDGQPVKNARELARKISSMAPGTSAKLGVWRKGEEKALTLTLGELPNTQQARVQTGPGETSPGNNVGPLGLSLAPAANVAGAGSAGVVVTQVDPDGPAAERGFRTGDVILDVGGKTVATPSDVRKAMQEAHAQGKHTILMRVKSGDQTKFVALPVGNA